MFNRSKQITHRIAFIATSILLVVATLAVALPMQRASAVGLAVTCSTYHTVSNGETLSSIALKYNVTVQELATANELKEPYQIFVGQRLCIPGTVSATAAATATAKTGPDFTITAGKTPYTIEIATIGYPAKSPYYVRILKSNRDGSSSQKLGTMKTNKSGVAKRTFRIPKPYRDIPVTICLKNQVNDSVQCNSYQP